jgi:hypothetical protein
MFSLVDTIREYLSLMLESTHPPKANMVLRLGFWLFNPVNLRYPF